MSSRPLPLIAPSILSADFTRLGEEVENVIQGGADWIHVDVMDGHFVPNLTIGPFVVEALRRRVAAPLDCHLMVKRPEDWIEPFAKAGATLLTVHVEATAHLDRLLHRIRDLGCQVGVSLNPGTPASALEEVLPLVDLVLVMSVNPGFGGQKFIPTALDKIRRLREMREARGLAFRIEVDGGVGTGNAKALYEAGADVFVAGSAVFGQANRRAAIAGIRTASVSG